MQAKNICLIFWTSEKGDNYFNLDVMLIENKIILIPFPLNAQYHYNYTYRKIPKISPSKYKPPKLVTQKTLR